VHSPRLKSRHTSTLALAAVVCVSGCANRQDSLLHMFFKKSLHTSTLFLLSANGLGGEGRGPIIGTPRGGGGGGGM